MEAVQARFDKLSKEASARQQRVWEHSVKAAGAPGSRERLAQTDELLGVSRAAINAGDRTKVNPFPTFCVDGPASHETWLWMVFDVKENASYYATAKGGSKLKDPATQEEALVAFLKHQLAMLKGARPRAHNTTGIVSIAKALELAANNELLCIYDCPHCGQCDIGRSSAWKSYRHPCPIEKANLVDLEAMQEVIASLEIKIGEQQKVQGRLPPMSKMPYSQRLLRFRPEGKATGRWIRPSDDPLLSQLKEQIATGVVGSSGFKSTKKTDTNANRGEKHGRLTAEDVLVTRIKGEQTLRDFFQARYELRKAVMAEQTWDLRWL